MAIPNTSMFDWRQFDWADTKKKKWPKTNIEIDEILNYLTEGGRPVDVDYGTRIRILLDACTWTETEHGKLKIVEFADKKKMLNVFLNTFETVEETIFWLKFADKSAIEDRMDKARMLVALSEKDS